MNPGNKNQFMFTEGPIGSDAISAAIQEGSAHHDAGAYSVFIGQVRNDVIEGKIVKTIRYTSNTEMAEKAMNEIITEAGKKFDLKKVKVIQSLGDVSKGEICLFVMAVCGHRRESFKAIEFIVEQLKKELPVWGQEIFEDNSHTWKINN